MDYVIKKYVHEDVSIQLFYNVYHKAYQIYFQDQLICDQKKKRVLFSYNGKTYILKNKKIYFQGHPLKEVFSVHNQYRFKTKRGVYLIDLFFDYKEKEAKIFINQKKIFDSNEQKKVVTFPLSVSYDGQEITIYPDKIFQTPLILLKFNARAAVYGDQDLVTLQFLKQFASSFAEISFLQYLKGKKTELFLLPVLLTAVISLQLYGISKIAIAHPFMYFFITIVLLLVFTSLTIVSMLISFNKAKKKYHQFQ